jgi:hypothetical protein
MMKWPKTLRARFALWTAGLLFLVLAVFGGYIYGSLARGLSAAIDDSLALNAAQVIAGLNIENGALILSDDFSQ